MKTPPRIPIAHLPTPLQPLERLGAEVGKRLWVKRDDLTGSGLSGNKVRKLEFSIAEAREMGADTLITCGGLQSNHCRATVIAGAKMGMKVHLVLRGIPEGMIQGNLLLDHVAGATVHTFPVEEYRARLAEIFQEVSDQIAAEGGKAHIIPLGASDDTGIWGYIAACEEIKGDLAAQGITNPHIVCSTGSGGTQAGLVVGNALYELGADIWGVNVCDDEAYFVKKIRSDVAGWKKKFSADLATDDLPINMLDGHVGPGYSIATDAQRETVRRVARTEGLILDPVYTGKGFHGMLEEIQGGRFDDDRDIIFIHTGGIYGLMAQAETFQG